MMKSLVTRFLGTSAAQTRLEGAVARLSHELAECRRALAAVESRPATIPDVASPTPLPPPVFVSDIDTMLRCSGRVSLEIAGTSIWLDLEHPHERRYAAYFLGFRYPQAHLDRLLLQKFIRSGEAVLDAGANIGMTALEALEAGAGHVYAVEPVPELAQRIRSLNHRSITCIEAALSDHCGPAELVLSLTHNQGSTISSALVELFPSVYSEHHRTVQVNRLTIDSLEGRARSAPVWKIDVEGSEPELIRGAADTLRQMPPRAVIVELYEPFYNQFKEHMRATHPYVKRAVIDRYDYSLYLLDKELAESDPDRYQNSSPTYVFTTDEAALR